jgi:hypothetical protein
MSDLDLPLAPGNALNYARPDIEYYVWQSIRELGNVVCWTLSAGEIDPHGWATMTNIQVDASGFNRARASTLADQCRRTIKALQFQPWSDGVVCSVDCTDGPIWQPDQNGQPRYIARYSIVTHPMQTQESK